MAEKHEIALQIILDNSERAQEKLDMVMQALAFIANHDAEFYALATFMQEQLQGYGGNFVAIRNQAKRLADLADPNAPEDLPF